MGVDATPARVQLGATEGTPAIVNASVTSTPGPTVNRRSRSCRRASTWRAGIGNAAWLETRRPRTRARPGDPPGSFPNGSSPASSLDSPPRRRARRREPPWLSRRRARCHAAMTWRAPSPPRPRRCTRPRRRSPGEARDGVHDAVECMPSWCVLRRSAAARAASRPQVSSQQSPPSSTARRSVGVAARRCRREGARRARVRGSAGLNVVPAVLRRP